MKAEHGAPVNLGELLAMTLGKKIRTLRICNKLSQEALCAAIEMRQGHLSRIERDQHPNLSVDTLKRLAKGLDVRFVIDRNGELDLDVDVSGVADELRKAKRRKGRPYSAA